MFKKILEHKLFIAKNNTNLGFTLAEVLVTLAIIGIIAAMSIPSLVQTTNNMEMRTAAKKKASELIQIGQKMVFDSGGSLANVLDSSDDMKNLFKSYLAYNKDCNVSADEGCWSPYGTMKSYTDVINDSVGGTPGLVLNDGTYITFALMSSDCKDGGSPSAYRCGYISIDINGPQKPNKYGYDIYGLNLLENGVNSGGTGDLNSFDYNNCGSSSGEDMWGGAGCLSWLMAGRSDF